MPHTNFNAMNWVLPGYLMAFLVTTIAAFWWKISLRKRRHPFPEDQKFLRAPGETQLNMVRKLEENLDINILGGACAPFVLSWPFLLLAQHSTGQWKLVWFLALIAVFGVVFILAIRWITKKLSESRDRYLGYFGERCVAEMLEPLKGNGWRIFHDVPCENNGHPFNIDHVAVGPGGAYVIETKTRRKGSARPGYKEHEVLFDGRVLIWPWGNDTHALEQAERNAVWLANMLKSETKAHVHVSPILALPGWLVTEKKDGKEARLARVANPKWLPKMLAGERVILDSTQIAAIASVLERRCRNIEYGS